MSKARKIKDFIANGIKVFHEASSMEYTCKSKEVKQFQKELFDESSELSDSEYLRQDQKNVARDLRAGFNDIVVANG